MKRPLERTEEQPRKKGRFLKAELLGKERSDPTTIRKVKLKSVLLEGKLLNPILAQVDAYAKLTHEATVFANVLADYAVQNGRWSELPGSEVDMRQFMQHCMISVRDYPTHYVKGRNALPPLMLYTLEHLWTKSTTTTGTKPSSYIMAPVSTQLGTNAHNHLFMHFYARQERALKRASYDAIRDAAVHACSNDNPTETQIRNKAASLRQTLINDSYYLGNDSVVLEHRSRLIRENGDKVDHKWLKKNCGRVMVYYHFLGRIEHDVARQHEAYHEQHGETPPNYLKAKPFTLLPVRGYGRHSLPIEANGLFGLMKDADLLPSGVKAVEFTTRQVEFFDQCFYFDRFTKLGRVHKACRVTTDGTSCSLSYFIPGGKAPSRKTKKKKEEIPYKNRIDLSTVTRGLFTDKNCRIDDVSNVVGCDPGKHSLISLGRKGVFLNYSKKEHYDKCFYKRGSQKRAQWNQSSTAYTQAVLEASTKQSFKIGNDLSEAWSARAPLEATLWAHYGDSRWRNLRFTQWSRKQKAYTDLVRKIRRVYGRDAIIAFGAAKYNVSSVGDVSGPLVEMARELSRHFRVVYTDEFRSSLGCYTCGLKTCEVARQGAGEKGSIFCIRRCQQCRRYRNRDRNAALNIGEFASQRLRGLPIRRNFMRGIGKTWPEISSRRPLDAIQ